MNYKELRPSLKASVLDAMYFSAMVGLGESYLGAYAIHLGASVLIMSLLGSLPQLLGSLSQLFSMRLLSIVPDRRKLVAVLAAGQSATWLPIAILGLFVGISNSLPFYVLLFACFYHILGNLTAPVWSSLIGDIVSDSERGEFFGLRNSRSGVITFLTMLIGGGILAASQSFSMATYGFILIFFFAGVTRGVSAYYLTKHDNPEAEDSTKSYFSFFQFIKALPNSNFARFVLCFSLMNGAIAVGGPFVSLYLLRDLGLSYMEFTAFAAINMITQFITFFRWGTLCNTFGAKGMLGISAIGVALFPFLLCLSSDYYWLLAIHALHGLFWAGYLISAQIFLLDAVTQAKRARCVAYQNVISGCVSYLGAVLGAFLANFHFIFPSSELLQLFALSALLRLVCAIFLIKGFKEVRIVERLNTKDIIFRLSSVRAISGLKVGLVWVRQKAKIK